MRCLELELAQSLIDQYSNEDWKHNHKEAMECRLCESHIALGLRAYMWLTNADSTIRAASVAGIKVPENIVSVRDRLYEAWLAPCADAAKWITQQENRGYTVENSAAFGKAIKDAQHRIQEHAILNSVDDIRNTAIPATAMTHDGSCKIALQRIDDRV